METICGDFRGEVQDLKDDWHPTYQERTAAEDWTHDHRGWLSGHHGAGYHASGGDCHRRGQDFLTNVSLEQLLLGDITTGSLERAHAGIHRQGSVEWLEYPAVFQIEECRHLFRPQHRRHPFVDGGHDR